MVSWLTAFRSSTCCNSINICSILKNEMSKSKFMSYLSETKEILKIEQKAFVLLLIKRRTFLGHQVLWRLLVTETKKWEGKKISHRLPLLKIKTF